MRPQRLRGTEVVRAIRAQRGRSAIAASVAVMLSLASCGPALPGATYTPPAPYQGSTAPPPALDRNGNPNYNASGQYVGGHGIGTLVDSPERANPPPPSTPSDMVREEQRKVDRAVCQGVNVGNPSACD
jgi:hypothetical protein